MQAAYYERVGPAAEVLQVGELPDPHPGSDEVRVRIEWSGVNPSDVKTRAGRRSAALPFPRIIPHSDGSGIIDEVGDRVSRRRLGQRVWLWNAAWGRPGGTASGYTCVPQAQAIALPEGVSGETGACLGIPALTAMHAVLMEGGVTGKRVLVAGGAGAVGHLAVQLAARFGAAQVLASVSTPQKAGLALAAGAEAVIHYRSESLIERVRELTCGEGLDRIIEVDAGANGSADCELLRPGGDCIVYGSSAPTLQLPFFPLISRNLQFRFFIVYNLTPSDRALCNATLDRLLRMNALQFNIGARLPLERIAEAHEIVETGAVTGNVVLRVS